MAEVSVRIGGRVYRLGCGEGEEAALTGYGKAMDQIAEDIQRSLPQPVPEGRLLVMVGMMLADQMAEMQRKTAEAERKAAEARKLADSRAAPDDLFNAEVEADMAARLDAIAARIENLTEKMV
ncbi:MAG: cell division protein ZapA [Pseudomonadota bacterium]